MDIGACHQFLSVILSVLEVAIPKFYQLGMCKLNTRFGTDQSMLS